MRLIELTNQRFGRLVVIGRAPIGRRPSGNQVTRWFCRCDCGAEKIVDAPELRKGATVSCGCYGKAYCGKSNIIHGKSHSPEYIVWREIHRRCYNPKFKDFHLYGGRGIQVDPSWHDSNPNGLNNFLRDMGSRPPKTTIDKIDNNKNYGPGNCRWANSKVQATNRRVTVWIEYDGRRMCQNDWAAEIGVMPSQIQYHLKRGRPFPWIYERLINNKRAA